MKKKNLIMIFLGIFFFNLISLSLVSAQSIDNPLLNFLLGDIEGGLGEVLAIKAMVVLIVALLIAAVLSTIDIFKQQKWIAWVIAFSMSIIGAKFISAQTLASLFLPTAAEIIALSLGLQFIAIVVLNYKLFHGVGMVRRIVWWVWAAALLIFLVKYGFWAFTTSTSINFLKWVGGEVIINRPSFVLTKTAVILYCVAIIAATAIGAKLDGWLAKMFRKEELEEMSSKLENTFGKSRIFFQESARSADDYSI